MGATNVAAAYAKYAGKVPPLSMVLLAYMALVSKDDDLTPWYGQGHAALAQAALGRQLPLGKKDRQAVERAITPLLAAGAITTDRRASVRRDGHHTVRYRLNLAFTLDLDLPRIPGITPPRHAPRNPEDVTQPSIDEPLVDNPPQDSQRPPEFGPHVPRKTGSRPPESESTSSTFRGTEEPGGDKEEREEEEVVDPLPEVAVARAHDPGCKNGFILNTNKIIRCRCNPETTWTTNPLPHAEHATATPPTAPTPDAPPADAPPAPANDWPPPALHLDDPWSPTTTGPPPPRHPPPPSAQDHASTPAPTATPPPHPTTATPAAGSQPKEQAA